MMGRTHSVHAEPTTFGLKLAGWAFELDRGRTPPGRPPSTRSAPARSPGPVGTYSHLEPDIEAEVLAALGLHADPVSTQIVQRDRHAALLTAIAILGGSLERFATEIRNLQHTEIGELQEPFKAGQKGSSRDAPQAQPDPVRADRRAGPAAARLRPHGARGPAALARARHQPFERRAGDPARRDDPARLHARADDRARRRARRPLRADAREHRARPRPPRVSRASSSRSSSDGGLSREEAYAIVQRAALRAADERAPLRDLLAVDPAVAQRLSLAQLDACFDDAAFLRHVPEVIARLDALADDWRPRPRPRRRRPMLAESFLRSGKVRDLYALDDGRLLLVASDRISAFDVVLPTDDPGQGPRADRPVAVLVRRDRGDRRRTTSSDGPRPEDVRAEIARGPATSADELRGRMMICRRASRRAGRGRSSAATSPARAGRTTSATRRGLRHPAAGRPARERPPARADLHAGDQGRAGRARREHRASTRWSSTSVGGSVDRRRRRARRGDPRSGARACTATRAAVAERRGILLADTKFEFGIERGDRRAAAHRRGPDARLVALLGRRDVRAGPAAGELRQAVRARLARDASLGQDRARARRCPTTSSTARAPATSRPSSGSPAPASSAISQEDVIAR